MQADLVFEHCCHAFKHGKTERLLNEDKETGLRRKWLRPKFDEKKASYTFRECVRVLFMWRRTFPRFFSRWRLGKVSSQKSKKDWCTAWSWKVFSSHINNTSCLWKELRFEVEKIADIWKQNIRDRGKTADEDAFTNMDIRKTCVVF